MVMMVVVMVIVLAVLLGDIRSLCNQLLSMRLM
jgi:hypothetical protein